MDHSVLNLESMRPPDTSESTSSEYQLQISPRSTQNTDAEQADSYTQTKTQGCGYICRQATLHSVFFIGSAVHTAGWLTTATLVGLQGASMQGQVSTDLTIDVNGSIPSIPFAPPIKLHANYSHVVYEENATFSPLPSYGYYLAIAGGAEVVGNLAAYAYASAHISHKNRAFLRAIATEHAISFGSIAGLAGIVYVAMVHMPNALNSVLPIHISQKLSGDLDLIIQNAVKYLQSRESNVVYGSNIDGLVRINGSAHLMGMIDNISHLKSIWPILVSSLLSLVGVVIRSLTFHPHQ